MVFSFLKLSTVSIVGAVLLSHSVVANVVTPTSDTKERVSGILPLSRTHLLNIPMAVTVADLNAHDPKDDSKMVNSNAENPDGPPPYPPHHPPPGHPPPPHHPPGHPPGPPPHHPPGPPPHHPPPGHPPPPHRPPPGHPPHHPPGPPPHKNDAFIHGETPKQTPANAIYSIQINSKNHINNEASAIAIPAFFGVRMEGKEAQFTAKSINHDACSPIPEINDKSKDYLAIIPRGGCPFDVKAKFALDAGYSAIAIYNDQYYADQTGDAPIRMIANELGDQVEDMIAMFLTNEEAQILLGDDVIVPTEFQVILSYIRMHHGIFKFITGPLLFHLSLLLMVISGIMSIIILVGFIRNYVTYGRFVVPHHYLAAPRLSKMNLPSKSYDSTIKNRIESCSICIEDFEHGNQIRILPCGHEFHADCVDPWLLRHNRLCPICKRDVVKMQDDIAAAEAPTVDEERQNPRPRPFPERVLGFFMGRRDYAPVGDGSRGL